MKIKEIGLQFFSEQSEPQDSTEVIDAAVDDFLQGFACDENTDDFFEEDTDSHAPQPTQIEQSTLSDGEQQTVEEHGQAVQSPSLQPPQMAQDVVSVAVGNTAIGLPKSAVDTLSGALGTDVAELIRRGLDYDNKGAREAELLSRLAEVSGKDLPTFMVEAEQQMLALQLEQEMQRVRARLPEGTPDEAVRMIAQKNVTEVNNRRAFEQYQRQQAQIQQAENARQQAWNQKIQPWRAYVQQFGISDMSQIPQAVLAYADAGMDPIAAHYRVLAEQAQEQVKQAQAASTKNAHNRQTSVGSMETVGDDQADAFLSGLLAED